MQDFRDRGVSLYDINTPSTPAGHAANPFFPVEGIGIDSKNFISPRTVVLRSVMMCRRTELRVSSNTTFPLLSKIHKTGSGRRPHSPKFNAAVQRYF